MSDKTRHQAIGAAKRNAIAGVILAISPIPLVAGKTVGDALADVHVRGPVDQWLSTRPATQIEFHQDLQVVVTLSTPGKGLADVFLTALPSAVPPIANLNQADQDRIRAAFAEHVEAGSHGSARAAPSAQHAPRV